MATNLSIEVSCESCGNELEIVRIEGSVDGDLSISVEPCPTCLEESE